MNATPIAVCVCTRDRPDQLRRLLAVLRELVRPTHTIFVIVDNGGRNSHAENLVQEFRACCRDRVEYVIEPRPGISAARNTALAVARDSGAGAAAMLDDDEWPSRGWLTELIETRSATGAAVVGGPVQPVFANRKTISAKYERLWSVQKGSLRGRLHVYCTCNCLVDLQAVSFLGGQPFPEEFGLTGGEDVVFFRRLHFAGVPMAWAEKAIVFEDVPAERATLAWMRRRWYRHGNAGVRCERAAPDPAGLSPFVKTLLLSLRLPFYPFAKHDAWSAPLLWILEAEKIRGRIASHMGWIRRDYAVAPNETRTVG